MRMRKRANLDKRMERCAELLIEEPETLRGQWQETFPDHERLYVELGCGKGRFTADTAETIPETLYIAVEKVPDAMILAMERAQAEGLQNVCFLDYDAAKLREIFRPEELDRIYINFCDPWPKSRDAKFRLTAPSFLRIYADLLPLGGEIRFKTDNAALFDWSVQQLEQEGWILRTLTRNLHAQGVQGILTDYERRFMEEGVPIKMLVAVRGEKTLDGRAGEPPRLRDAALADARGNREGEEKP